MRTWGIILARAGSKGVPGKNRAIVGGRPCVMWTVDDAREAASLSRVILTSDDQEILRLGVESGVDVVVRPPEHASDDASVEGAVNHALSAVDGDAPDAVAILYANVPVRPSGLVDRAVALLAETGAHSVQSYARVGKHHPWWTARIGDDARIEAWDGGELNHGVHRRQDLPPAFVPDGGVLAVTVPALRRTIPEVVDGPHAFFGRDRRGVETPEGSVVDIDAPIDLIVADALLRERVVGVAP